MSVHNDYIVHIMYLCKLTSFKNISQDNLGQNLVLLKVHRQLKNILTASFPPTHDWNLGFKKFGLPGSFFN